MKDYNKLSVFDSAVNGYDQGYEDGHKDAMEKISDVAEKEAYQKGLNDAWECAKKIARMDTETSENVTGYFGLFRIMDNLTAAEAIEKVKAYEQKQDTVQVGDEVISFEKIKGVVIGILNRYWSEVRFTNSPSAVGVYNYTITKTGRHYPEIAEVLKQMQGE